MCGDHNLPRFSVVCCKGHAYDDKQSTNNAMTYIYERIFLMGCCDYVTLRSCDKQGHTRCLYCSVLTSTCVCSLQRAAVVVYSPSLLFAGSGVEKVKVGIVVSEIYGLFIYRVMAQHTAQKLETLAVVKLTTEILITQKCMLIQKFGGPTIRYVMTENWIYGCCGFWEDVSVSEVRTKKTVPRIRFVKHNKTLLEWVPIM